VVRWAERSHANAASENCAKRNHRRHRNEIQRALHALGNVTHGAIVAGTAPI
jgi:hypothetical protein